MIAAMRVARAAFGWLWAAWVAITIVWRIGRGEVVVLSGQAAPVLRLVAIVLVFLAGCVEKLRPAPPGPGTGAQEPGPQEEAGDELAQGTGVEVVVAGSQMFPDNLDDAGIERALKWLGRRELWRSFEAEPGREGDGWSLALRAPEGEAPARLVAAVEEHRAWAQRGEPATAATLLSLLDAAEAVPVYDAWLAGHVWRHARGLQPAPALLLGRIERHLRVVQAMAQGEASTGPIEFSAWRSKAGPPAGWSGLRVPAGLAAAARAAFAKVDAGTWETGSVLGLTVARGEGRLLRRGGEAPLTAGMGLRLRRLDVVRAAGELRLRHAGFGVLVVPAGGELTAWNAGERLSAEARARVSARVMAALGGEAAALAELEMVLPLAHAEIRAAVAGKPDAPGAAGLRLLLTGFDE